MTLPPQLQVLNLKRKTAAPSNRRSLARRDWRLAAVAGCCSTLGFACVLLAACSGNSTRPEPQFKSPSLAPLVSIAPNTQASDIVIDLPEKPVSPWQRLRNHYAMPGCNYSPTVQKFAQSMAASPLHLTAALKQAMPYLLVVTDQIEKFDMPGEFAFLPWVESSYTMIPPSGDGVAGMWQLMPSTARGVGLRVDSEYDGRLDVYASSLTALGLIKQYKEEFGDWRLANMAFNAGENSVKQALGTRRTFTAAEIAKLHLNTTTYEHLSKLLALACVVSDPQRFHVQLPEPRPEDVPAVLQLPAPIDMRLAAQLAGMDLNQMQHWNPAYMHSHTPDSGPYHLLVPANRRVAMESALGMLPQYSWRDWRDMKLQQSQSLDMLSMAYDLDARALAAINRVDANAMLPAGTRLLLPGHGRSADVVAVEPVIEAISTNATASDGTCTVHPGDTLWQIARRYRVRVEDLMQWNRLPHNATLRLGQRILLNSTGNEAGLFAH